jgi:hypothetical protein
MNDPKTPDYYLVQQIGQTSLQLAALAAQNAKLGEKLQESQTTMRMLYECVKSGQVSEDGIAELLKDPLFKAFYTREETAKIAAAHKPE